MGWWQKLAKWLGVETASSRAEAIPEPGAYPHLERELDASLQGLREGCRMQVAASGLVDEVSWREDEPRLILPVPMGYAAMLPATVQARPPGPEPYDEPKKYTVAVPVYAVAFRLGTEHAGAWQSTGMMIFKRTTREAAAQNLLEMAREAASAEQGQDPTIGLDGDSDNQPRNAEPRG